MKFLYGYFDQNTGKSVVLLADRYGKYIGQAKLHPDDKNHASQYMGCALAQQRAWIKGLKKRGSRIKIKINTIKSIIKDIELNIEDNKEIIKRLNIQLKNYNNQINDINNQIKEIEQNIKKRIQIREKIINNK